VAALLLAFFLQGFFASRLKGPSSDECIHILAGATYIATHSIVINPQHPPLLKELAGLSMALGGMHWGNRSGVPIERLPMGWEWKASDQFLIALGVARVLSFARFPLLLVSTLTGLVIFCWGRKLAGASAGVAALFLFAADPNMLGHSYFVTTDSAVTALSLLFLLVLYRYFERPGRARAAMSGVTLGLALCAKFSAVFLLPITAILVYVAFRRPTPTRDKRGRAQKSGDPPFPVAERLTELAILGLCALVVIDICYFSLKGPWLYLYGLGRVNADHRLNFHAFLAGQVQHRFLSYFLVAWLVKEPLATVGLAGAGAYLVFRRHSIPLLAKLFVFVPPIVFFAACTVWADNIGIRYLMPAMPFGFLTGGIALARLFQGGKVQRIAGAAACVWLVAAAVGIYPDNLSYFNEMACVPDDIRRIGLDGGSACGTSWLADSNVDWGENLPQLAAWLDHNVPGEPVGMKYLGSISPSAYGIRFHDFPESLPPSPGVYVISAHYLAYWHHSYSHSVWLQSEPIAVVAHAYYIFRF
jgi:hypothetical protein